MKLSFYLNSLITPPCFFPIVAIAGTQSIFGSQVIGGYQDAQSFDHRDATTDPENFELFRNLDEVAGENAEDTGTQFENDDHLVENNTHHHYRGGYQQQPARASNLHQGTQPSKSRGQHQRFGGNNVLNQQNQNVMAKKQKNKILGGHGRGETSIPKQLGKAQAEAHFLKQEVDRANREAADLKRQLEEYQKKDKGGHKKVKVVGRKAQPKMEIAGVWSELKDVFKKFVYTRKKFMRNEMDEEEVMLDCLMLTNEWPQLKDLEQEDLMEEVRTYLATYGSKMTAWMNECRSQDQTSCRQQWLHDLNKGIAFTWEQVLKVALRHPKHLRILDEENGSPEVNERNKEVNLRRRSAPSPTPFSIR